MTKQENKNSAKKKLIPAVAMLTTSAVMLSTSTYAWFTMSREVEVQNIQMTATTPEDIQLSLGAIGSTNIAIATNESEGTLTASSGVLLTELDGQTTVGGVIAPQNTWDWSHTADIGAYYQFGKLIPASSNTGENIFFTPDASGVGRTLKDSANFYQASNAKSAQK
ncbi:MAG: hypothetical protein SPE43_09745, partial [Ruminococcus sp.]|nr:hypothetical protein [Ruminococcus sp.]